ncbi:fibronectin type III domain-containing protein [Shewanella sedimentimangrovi]|uniref:Fibronectin type III domain-containing protein n=1 Tax=Shewanella sedimentimangrovi TaxID=2814293 RepID=A0ABX7QYB5_9GAMM|nr:fibronectin type III domain-containing protein [Shewanella sedimentimangrovi]QSX36522.1 fibronectin type III domain-containing protein [Shewanella sedimentimangrovi]
MNKLKIVAVGILLLTNFKSFAIGTPAPSIPSLSGTKPESTVTLKWSPECTASTLTYTIQESLNDAFWNTVYTGPGDSGMETSLVGPLSPSGENHPASNNKKPSKSTPSLIDCTTDYLPKSLTLSSRNNRIYYYRIKACSSSACSAYSSSLIVASPPYAPQISSNYQAGQAGYTINWTPVSGDIVTSYQFQENPFGRGWSATTGLGLTTSKAYQSMLPGTYYHRVRACNDSGCGLWSNSTSVIIPSPIEQCSI